MRGAHDVPALVLGGGYTALSTARSLGCAGIEVLLAAERVDFAARSRFVRGHVGGVEETAEGVLEAAKRLGIARAVLFPCSDVWIEVVASLTLDSRERFPASVPPPHVVSLLLDKAALAEALRRHGIPHPRTVPVERAEDLDAMESSDRRWILKPRSSQSFHRLFDRKAFFVRTRAEAEERLAACTRIGLQMVLQEYVPGPATAHVLIDGFLDAGGVLRGRIARRRLRKYPLELGESSLGVYIPERDVEEPARRLEELLLAIGYRGIFDAEFKLDPGDGTHKLLEVNCRPFMHVDFAQRSNLCLLAYCDALGLPLPRFEAPPVGKSYVFAAVEARALVEQHRQDDLGTGQLLVGLARLAVMPARRDDPLPALAHLVELAAKARSRRGQAKRARR